MRSHWRSGLRRLGAVVLALGLAGCTVGPDYHPPRPAVPQSWHLADGRTAVRGRVHLARWWRRFRDPVLDSLIARAARGNLGLKEAVARVKEARAALGVALGRELPALDAQGAYTRQRGSENDLSPGGVTTSRYSAEMDASWEIDLFGRVRRAVEAARAEYQASREDRRDVLVSLYAEVARSYFTVRTLQARLAAARKNISSQRETLRLTRVRFKNGLAAALDVAQAESVLASSQAELPPLEMALHQAMNACAILLGLPPGSLHAELSRPRPIPTPPPRVAVGIPADILRQRPDVRRAERRLAAATARIGVATADLYPTLTLTGTLGLAAGDLGKLWRGDSHFYTFGPSLFWKIFDAGRIRSRIKVADARTEQALYAYQQAVLEALGEVEDALVACSRGRARVAALERTVAAARRTLELAVRLYKDGLTDFQSVLDAQRSLFAYDNQLAQARGDFSLAVVRLYKALGGGWQSTRGAGKASAPAGDRGKK